MFETKDDPFVLFSRESQDTLLLLDERQGAAPVLEAVARGARDACVEIAARNLGPEGRAPILLGPTGKILKREITLPGPGFKR